MQHRVSITIGLNPHKKAEIEIIICGYNTVQNTRGEDSVKKEEKQKQAVYREKKEKK